jgi:hypothetical protein
MFQMLIDPPVSYVFALLIGFIMGGGVELIDVGLLSFSVQRIIKKRKSHLIAFLSIFSFTFGFLFTVTGIILFLMLIVDTFMAKAHIFSLSINIILAMTTAILLIIPVFLRRRGRKILRND